MEQYVIRSDILHLYSNGGYTNATLEISMPFKSAEETIVFSYFYHPYFWGEWYLIHPVQASYDGFTMYFPTPFKLNATIDVYGYNVS
jgi:hypothetical protein